MNKHTPGPWIVDGAENRIVATDDRQTIICHLSASCRNPEVMADARLIAAAPELLEALRKAAESFEVRCAFGDADMCRADHPQSHFRINDHP